jgi:hypothetical protein
MMKADNFTIGLFTIGEYTINCDTIIFNFKYLYDDESGLLAPINPAGTITLKYLFSGDKLILAADGQIITFKKIYTASHVFRNHIDNKTRRFL